MGGLPYSEVPPAQLKAALMRGSADMRPAIPPGCHPDWVQLMQVGKRMCLLHVVSLVGELLAPL
jgi:hypothetical protein